MHPFLYVDETGVPIRLRCGIDITGAVWPAQLHEGTAMQYTLQAGDLALVGTWRVDALTAQTTTVYVASNIVGTALLPDGIYA